MRHRAGGPGDGEDQGPTGAAGATGPGDRAAAAVDADRLLADARALVRIPTHDGAETAAQEWMAAAMEAAGLEVDVWEIDMDAVRTHPHGAWEIERERPLGVVGTLRGAGGGRSLILNGHVDVVPPGNEEFWTHPPFEGVVENGRLHGRGALDLKGPLVAALHAVQAVRASGVHLDGSVHLMSVIGEEDGGMGTLAAILRGYRADGAVVLEPTGLAVAPAQAGCQNFRIVVPGRAAHGAVREEGVSAIEKLFPVYAAVQALEAERNERLGGSALFAGYRRPFAISIGTVRGGDWASSVPDHVTVEGRMGGAPGEDPASARAELEAAVARAAAADPFLADHPPRVSWWGGRYLAAETPIDHPLVTTLRSAAESVTGQLPRVEGMTYGADMGLLSEVGGVPTVLYGAGDIRRAHRPDEYVEVDELVTMARVLARAIVGYCGR